MIFILFHSYHLFVVSLESKYVKCVILTIFRHVTFFLDRDEDKSRSLTAALLLIGMILLSGGCILRRTSKRC